MAITFNESYYLQTNPDVALAVSLRQFASGADHFNKLGANELRNPNAVFDSKYYAAQNPDVLTAVSAKTFSSVYAHYLANGLKEGRAPNASLKGFDGADYIAKNPDVATAGFTAATALQHYVQYGVDENRPFTSTTAGAVVGNVTGTVNDDTVTPAGGQTSAVRVEGGQQGAAGDTLVITSGSASSFQVIDLSNNGGDQNQTRDNQAGTNTGNKVGPVVQGFENVDARQATINMNITALDRTSITNTGSAASTQTGSVLQGGTGRDTLAGNNGNDVITGNDGNDNITGGAGNDNLSGGVGADTIGGGTGNDTIVDGAGDDVVTGDAGADIITVEAGLNNVDGGADNDTINVTVDQATSTTVSTIAGGAGDDTINLGASVGTAASAITAASRTSVSGGTGNDTILASLGVETVNAGAGNDTVRITATNLGATDVFNGNDGQDIIQLEIPSGSGTNTFVFTPVGTTAATSQFNGFEAIALIDSSGNTTAKSYKLILTDTFLAQNLVNGSFLIDARGLPGGSNLVIDFSALTAASAARFTAGAFRVLTSPSTDVRDQNNVGIINSYTVNTGNSLLAATAAFSVYAGETTITAGTAAAYNTDRTVATGSGQAAYTTTGGTAETGSAGTTGGTFTLTAANAILGATFDSVNVTPAGRLSAGADVINAGLLANNAFISDSTTGDADVVNMTLTAAVATTTPVIAGIETINVAVAGSQTLALASASGYSTINYSAGNAAFTQTVTGLASAVSQNFDAAFTGSVTHTLTTASGAVNYGLNGGTITTINDTNGTGVHTFNVNANTTIGTLTAGAAWSAMNVTGAGNLTITNALTANTLVVTSTGTGALTVTASGTASSITGGSGSDSITGGAGADTLAGGVGNDTISSGGGGDIITGGAGADRIVLGAGADIVRYSSSTEGGSGGDTITAFLTAGADVIRIADTLRTEIDRDLNGTVAQVSSTGAAGNAATAAGTEVLFSLTANSALTTANFSSTAAVATALNAMYNFTNTAVGTAMLVLVAGSAATDNVLYYYKEAGGSTGDNAVDASELTLIGVITSGGALTANAADLVFGT